MIRRILLLLPLGLGAAAMAAGAALLMGNLAAVALRLTGPDGMKLAHGLAGVSFAEQPQLSLQAVAQGRFQAAFARVVGARMPLYPLAVRVRNQVEYSLFGLSAAPNLLIGPGGMLSEVAYAREYCARAPGWQADGARWAAGIREMQGDAERRGKAFLYVLTPSKVAQYPQVLPPGWACPASAADRAGFVPEWMALLRDAGVHAVDTSTVLLAAHGDYPFPLYPTGGTHWNAVGAALAEQAIMAALDRLLPGRGFAPFRFTWRMAPHPDPEGTDQDLARLTNLFHLPDDGPVPVITLQPAPPPAVCDPPHVVIVGGSFSNGLGAALGSLPCPVPTVEYQYWHALRLDYPGGRMRVRFVVLPPERDAMVLAANVLIYEENEEASREHFHGTALLNFLRNPSASTN